MNSASNVPNEIQHIPMWVKGILAVGLILFLIQIPKFDQSLTDACLKHRASKADKAGLFPEAIQIYSELLTRYPTDKDLIKLQAFAQYHSGEYREALSTLKLLAEVKMPKFEVEEINKLVDDILLKMNN